MGLRLGEFAATLSTLGATATKSWQLEHASNAAHRKAGREPRAPERTDGAIAELTEGAPCDAELIRASAEQTATHLPRALAGTEERLAGSTRG